MSFNVEEFIVQPTKRELFSLSKPQLKQVVERLEISCEPTAKKPELRQLVLDHFVEEDIMDELQDGGTSELEIKRLELEHKAREQEKERECQIKMKELELRQLEIEMAEKELAMKRELEMKEKDLQLQLKLKELEVHREESSSLEVLPRTASFDMSRQVRLVPAFQEQEVDKFFLHFEKVATNLHWPRDALTMLLQSVLVGKAREVFSALSVEQCADYELVKREILKAYQLVPEAY